MKHAAFLLGTTLMCGAPGCFFSSNDSVPATASTSTGSLTVGWTINSSSDPNQCNQSVATDFEIFVATTDGATVGDFIQRCSDGATSITLNPGAYAADAALLDATGTERTTRVAINPFVINSRTDLSIWVDFPANSFR